MICILFILGGGLVNGLNGFISMFFSPYLKRPHCMPLLQFTRAGLFYRSEGYSSRPSFLSVYWDLRDRKVYEISKFIYMRLRISGSAGFGYFFEAKCSSDFKAGVNRMKNEALGFKLYEKNRAFRLKV